MTPIKEQRFKPKYKVISEHLRDQIIQRKFAVGQALPSQRDLMAMYDASQSTVRQSLSELSQAGLLRAEPGRGVFVQDPQSLSQQHNQRRLGTIGFAWWYHPWEVRDEGRHIDRVYLYIMRIAAETLQASNREMLYGQFDHGEEDKMRQFAQGLGGVIVIGEVDPMELRKANLPNDRIVIAGHTLNSNGLESFTNAVADSESAGNMAVQILAGYQHKHIAFVNEEGSLFFDGLSKGFDEAVKSSALPEPKRFIAFGVNREEEVARAIAEDDSITAVIVVGDSNAERMIRNLNRFGVSVPQDKSVLGIGGLPRAEMAVNDLSRINTGYDRIGIECANLIAADRFVVTHLTLPAKVEMHGTVTVPKQ